MWKPTTQTPVGPTTRPNEPERAAMPMASTPPTEPTAAPPRPVSATTADQATIGKSLVIKVKLPVRSLSTSTEEWKARLAWLEIA